MSDTPRATYRLQLQPAFGFDAAAELVDYLRELGVSHLYASPYLQAAAGSTHGYDVVDPSRPNEELGGAEGHERMCKAVLDAGLKQLLDIVPNHMAIVGRQNPWWWDVLENGPSSRYALYFDVDWETSEERWPNKVLLPVLGDHYGRVLERGEFQLQHQRAEFVLKYFDHEFPIDPSSLAALLGRAAEGTASELLAFLAESYARLPRPTVVAQNLVARRHRDKAILHTLLTRLCADEPGACAAVDREVARINSDVDALDELIEQQNYRLAFWRTASRDLGYRRFFDVTSLAGLRVENLEVFNSIHALPVEWVKRGWVHGLRVDHPDGLRDPAEYFRRLREACPGAWLLAEKIIEPGEVLPGDWPIAGTTGYDYLNIASGLLVHPEGGRDIVKFYSAFTGESDGYEDVVAESKRWVLRELLVSELNRLTNLFVAICERHRRHRDYTSFDLREALTETALAFPVYRSYVSATKQQVNDTDRQMVGAAIAKAKAARPDLDPELFEFLRCILLLEEAGSLEGELAMRFQQLTGPAMAKGVEDTAFYRYLPLTCLNEVGGDPGHMGVSLEHFHAAMAEAAVTRPEAMLSSTTHDTKRSEDVRARIAVLSEMPAEWQAAVLHFHELLAGQGAPAIDVNTEYLIYQTLVGAYPISVERLHAYLEKACREAKRQTAWTAQDAQYEAAVKAFAERALGNREFIKVLTTLVNRIQRAAEINALSQTLIKLTAPGVPDIYQGNELWDYSLVDPDNRRPVDFEQRRALLAEINNLSVAQIVERSAEGLPKLWLTRTALKLREGRPESFSRGASYTPINAKGPHADSVVAYLRGADVAVVAQRFSCRRDFNFDDTTITLPPGEWRNLLDGGGTYLDEVPLARLLAHFPVALLTSRRR